MANLPPFMNSVGLIPKIIDKLIVAQQPARFTQDFLSTKLGFPGGSARPFIPLLKRLGMLQSDGTPTDLYAKLRNPSERGAAVAAGMRIGYASIFERNEFAGSMPREKLKNLVIEMTGLSKDNATLKAIVGTFAALAAYADFDVQPQTPSRTSISDAGQTHRYTFEEGTEGFRPYDDHRGPASDEVALNLAYTINLNLPESANPEVFNAIFKALREHLLRK